MMKRSKLFLFFLAILLASNVHAQTTITIETGLLKSFKQIDYWNTNQDADATGTAPDKLAEANDSFARLLQTDAIKYPATINWPFISLVKDHINVSSSTDGLFRIYSWDTQTGGTMHFFESVFQYKVSGRTIAVLDTPKTEGDNRPNYTKLYTFKAGNKTYYLAVYLTIASTKDAGQGIQVFDIKNGKLNNAAKITKTASGLHSQLYYDYDFFSVVDIPFAQRPGIFFDETTQTIHVPLVNSNGKVTHSYIVYKFTGQYFERLKN